MTQPPALLGPPLQYFFTEHLCQHKRVSANTIASCRDTFRLLLRFLQDHTKVEPARLRVSDVDADQILAFLDHLEQQRGNSIRSRNVRLSAIRSFFRVVALREPDSAGMVTRILAIPTKREEKRLVGFLTRDEMEAVIAAPDRSKRSGRRDHALLLTMYNSGARVSEMTALRRDQVQFGATNFLQLLGKGRKERTVPLWPQTATVLKAWFKELVATPCPSAFPSARGTAMARDGIEYILRQAVHTAAVKCPSLVKKRVCPHVLRHTTAMHLLQSGVDISVIALWLGHESIETTHGYIEADLATKERALQKLKPHEDGNARFKPDDKLLAFLASL